MAKKQRQKKREDPTLTLEEDIDLIRSSFEALLDEIDILGQLDKKLGESFKNHYYNLHYDKGKIHQLIEEKKIKGIRDVIMQKLTSIENSISSRLTQTEEHFPQDEHGNDVTGRYRYDHVIGDDGIVRSCMVVTDLPEMSEERRWLYPGQHPLTPDERRINRYPSWGKRSVPPMDPRVVQPSRDAIKKLQVVIRSAWRRHQPTKPIYKEVLDRLAGKGPTKLRDICKMVYDVRLEYGGAGPSDPKRKMADPQGVISMLCKVDFGEDFQATSSLDGTWTIPADYKLKPTWAQIIRDKEEKDAAAVGFTKPKTAVERRAAKARLVDITKKMIALVATNAKAVKYRYQTDPSFILQKSVKKDDRPEFKRLSEEWGAISKLVTPALNNAAMLEAYPDLKVDRNYLIYPTEVIAEMLKDKEAVETWEHGYRDGEELDE